MKAKIKNKDFLHKYLVLDHQARVITVFSTDVVNEYCKNIQTTPVSIAAMGRLISATLMMGSMLKGKERVMLSIEGNGPIGTIRAEADSNGNVRAFASNPTVSVPLNERGFPSMEVTTQPVSSAMSLPAAKSHAERLYSA